MTVNPFGASNEFKTLGVFRKKKIWKWQREWLLEKKIKEEKGKKSSCTSRGVDLAQSTFHCCRTVFSSLIKSTVGHILAKDAVLRINLNIDGAPIPSGSDTPPSPSQTSNLSPLSLVSIFRCPSPPWNPVYVRRVDPSVLAFSLSLHRPPYIYFLTISNIKISLASLTLVEILLCLLLLLFLQQSAEAAHGVSLLALLCIIVLAWHFPPGSRLFLFWYNKIIKLFNCLAQGGSSSSPTDSFC